MADHAASAPAALASEKEARDVAEAARESEWSGPSFVRELFLGRFRLDLIHPHPVKDDPAEAARAAPFFAKLRAFLAKATRHRPTALAACAVVFHLATQRSAAHATSAVASTIAAEVEPSSSTTFFLPARAFIAQPTSGLPVNESSL